MKRLAIGLAMGALGILFLLPPAHAQSWQDMQSDRGAIEEGHEQINHDRQELRNDLRNGNYGAAAQEQAEINSRRAQVRERQEDLNNDVGNRYYGDDDSGWRHHDDEDDD
jgi:UPF0716 family protein affecting phage T7 exclusion